MRSPLWYDTVLHGDLIEAFWKTDFFFKFCFKFRFFLFHVSHRTINVSLPKKTRNNGTLYALIFVHQAAHDPWHDPRQVHLVAQLTTYMVPKPPEISLISGEDKTKVPYCLCYCWKSSDMQKNCAVLSSFNQITKLLSCLCTRAGSERRPAEEAAWCSDRGRSQSWSHLCVRPSSFTLALPPHCQHCRWPLPLWQRIPPKWCPQIPQSVRWRLHKHKRHYERK